MPYSSWIKETGSWFFPICLSDIVTKAMCPFSGFPKSLQTEYPVAI